MEKKPDRISEVQPRIGAASYPAHLRGPFEGRKKRMLSDVVGISQFGINHTTLEPGAMSALRHWHEGEDEFVYILSGTLTLIDDNGEHILTQNSFAGFPAGRQNGHQLANKSSQPAIYLEIGSRKPGEDTVHYPDDDIGPIER